MYLHHFHCTINMLFPLCYTFLLSLQTEGVLELLLKSQHLEPLVFMDMMDFCILHGYKISRDSITKKVLAVKALQNCEQIHSWLQEVLETVPTLSNICRNFIREQLSSSNNHLIQKNIAKLPLPPILKDFIAYQDEECESLLKLSFWFFYSYVHKSSMLHDYIRCVLIVNFIWSSVSS